MLLRERISNVRDQHKEGVFTNAASKTFHHDGPINQGIVMPILQELGWDIFDVTQVVKQYQFSNVGYKNDGGVIDVCLMESDKEHVIIEVKRQGRALDKAVEQAFHYAYYKGVPIVIATDGTSWKFYYTVLPEGEYNSRKIAEFSLITSELSTITSILKNYLKYDLVISGEAMRNAKKDYEEQQLEKEWEEAFEETWNKLVEEEDEFIVDTVQEKMGSICQSKPSKDFVLSLLKRLKPESSKLKKLQDSSRKGQKPRQLTQLSVIIDGEKIRRKISADTFAETIKKIGVEKVKKLNISYGKQQLISEQNYDNYGQRDIGNYKIITQMSNIQKKRILHEIAQQLSLNNIEVQLIDL